MKPLQHLVRLFVFVVAACSALAQSTVFTYQGRLIQDGLPASGRYDLTCQLFDAASGGITASGVLTNSAVAVADGLFTVNLDFGSLPFSGAPLWLEIGVRTNASGGFNLLQPRQSLTAAPFAIRAVNANQAAAATSANSVPWAGLTGLPAGFADGLDNDTLYGAGAGLSLFGTEFSVNFVGSGASNSVARSDHVHRATDITTGTLADARLSTNVALLSGSPTFAGAVTSGGQIKGTSLNVGQNHSVSGSLASISAGQNNTNQADHSFIGGGRTNVIESLARQSAIVGGSENLIGASSYYSVIGGGQNNLIPPNAQRATIPGGSENEATDDAFAAGSRAKARHQGAFVWADSQGSDFVSGKNNSFLIRAQGGVGINTNNPQTALHVHGRYVRVSGLSGEDAYMGSDGYGGDVMFGSFNPAVDRVGFWNVASSNRMSIFASNVTAIGQFVGNGSGLTSLSAASVSSGTFADSRLSTNVVLLNSANVRFTGAVAMGGDLRAPRAMIGTNHFAMWPLADAPGCSILGGQYNFVEEASRYSTIAGGSYNYIGDGSQSCFVGGGVRNQVYIYGLYSGILSGITNVLGNDSEASVIAGGEFNQMGGGTTAGFIGGGRRNLIGGIPIGPYANNNTGNTIGGGAENEIQFYSSYNTIGGGYDNIIRSNTTYATIAGGYRNEATNRAFAAGYRAKARHTGSFVWADSTSLDFVSDRTDQFKVRAGGGVRIEADASGLNPAACHIESTTAAGVGLYVKQTSSDANAVFSNPGTGDLIKGFSGAGGANLVFRVDNDGDVTAKTFTPSSDRNMKENFAPVDPQAVLARVAALPISRWNFKADATQHIGPMAQDFQAAFAVGPDDKHIATVDADGVALAAIQGLNRKVEAKEAKIAELERRLAALEALLNSRTK